MSTMPLQRLLASPAAANFARAVVLTGAPAPSAAGPTARCREHRQPHAIPRRRTGRIGHNWWTSVIALSTVMTHRRAIGEPQCDYAILEAFTNNRDFTNESVDDICWWAFAWIQIHAPDTTGNREHLNTAKTATSCKTTTGYMHDCEDSLYGGVYWRTRQTARGGNRQRAFPRRGSRPAQPPPGDTTYLRLANAEWNFRHRGPIDGNLVREGLNVSGCSFDNANYTYSRRVILQGPTALSRALGNTGLLTTARLSPSPPRGSTTMASYTKAAMATARPFQGIFNPSLRALAIALNSLGYMNSPHASIVPNKANSIGQNGNSFVGSFAHWLPINRASGAAIRSPLSAAAARSCFSARVHRASQPEPGIYVDGLKNTQVNGALSRCELQLRRQPPVNCQLGRFHRRRRLW